jgi:hypothetical protein
MRGAALEHVGLDGAGNRSRVWVAGARVGVVALRRQTRAIRAPQARAAGGLARFARRLGVAFFARRARRALCALRARRVCRGRAHGCSRGVCRHRGCRRGVVLRRRQANGKHGNDSDRRKH